MPPPSEICRVETNCGGGGERWSVVGLERSVVVVVGVAWWLVVVVVVVDVVDAVWCVGTRAVPFFECAQLSEPI
jgi:hypothetical protein